MVRTVRSRDPKREESIRKTSPERIRDRRHQFRRRQGEAAKVRVEGTDGMAAVLRRRRLAEQIRPAVWHQWHSDHVARGQEGQPAGDERSRRSRSEGREIAGGIKARRERRHPCRRLRVELFAGKGAGAPGNGSWVQGFNARNVLARNLPMNLVARTFLSTFLSAGSRDILVPCR